jgi:pfkB family carbohydrate kinase
MRVALVARVGNDDRGDAAVSRLCAEGVVTRFIVQDGEARTGVVLVQVDQHGQKQTLSAPGAIGRLTVADVEAATDAIRSARALFSQLECRSRAPRQPRTWKELTLLSTALPGIGYTSGSARRLSSPAVSSAGSSKIAPAAPQPPGTIPPVTAPIDVLVGPPTSSAANSPSGEGPTSSSCSRKEGSAL